MSEHGRTPRRGWNITLGMLILLAVGIGGYWYYADLNPKVNISPPPAVPSPNARDFYLQAHKTLHAQGIQDIWSVEDIEQYTMAQKQAAFTATQPCLDMLHEGMKYPYQFPTVYSFETSFQELAKYRSLIRYLKFAGEMKAAQGDWNGAMQCYLDVLHVGKDVPHGSLLIGMLVGVTLQATGRENCWETIDHLDADQARAAVKRLEIIIADQASMAEELQEEKRVGQMMLRDIFQQAKWREKYHAFIGNSIDDKSVTLSQRLSSLFITKHRAMQSYSRDMDTAIAMAKAPYTNGSTDQHSSVQIVIYKKSRQKHVVNALQNDLLLVSLALRAYKVEHWKYPATLDELVPSYLTKIPDDPFAVGQPLQYKVTGATYVLYSIGPDRKDDGGKPIEHRNVPEYYRHSIFEAKGESIGDAVAGVNRL